MDLTLIQREEEVHNAAADLIASGGPMCCHTGSPTDKNQCGRFVPIYSSSFLWFRRSHLHTYTLCKMICDALCHSKLSHATRQVCIRTLWSQMSLCVCVVRFI